MWAWSGSRGRNRKSSGGLSRRYVYRNKSGPYPTTGLNHERLRSSNSNHGRSLISVQEIVQWVVRPPMNPLRISDLIDDSRWPTCPDAESPPGSAPTVPELPRSVRADGAATTTPTTTNTAPIAAMKTIARPNFAMKNNTRTVPAKPNSAITNPNQGPTLTTDTFPCQCKNPTQRMPASPNTRPDRITILQPNEIRVRTRNAANANNAPLQGPLLNVNIKPSSWTPKIDAHKTVLMVSALSWLILDKGPQFSRSPFWKWRVAAISVTGTVMVSTVAAKIALPMKIVTLAEPPPVDSVRLRKS